MFSLKSCKQLPAAPTSHEFKIQTHLWNWPYLKWTRLHTNFEELFTAPMQLSLQTQSLFLKTYFTNQKENQDLWHYHIKFHGDRRNHKYWKTEETTITEPHWEKAIAAKEQTGGILIHLSHKEDRSIFRKATINSTSKEAQIPWLNRRLVK